MTPNEAKEQMHRLMQLVIEKSASDLFITVAFPPAVKVDGELKTIGHHHLSEAEVIALLDSVSTPAQREAFERANELNFAYEAEDVGRFRVNWMKQKGKIAAVLRRIPTEIASIEALRLPPVLKKISLGKRGLVLMVGSTGSGKSTTLAAMVDHRSTEQAGHIVTVEDPIEFIHNHKKSIVHQREVGMDTQDWHSALKNTLRQAPDVILIGEIRDKETMEHAIAFSETGHLCMATLHANNANQALDRIIHFFPEVQKRQILMDLSFNLKAVVSQRLVPIREAQGRVPAVEILLQSPYVSDLIGKGEIGELKEVMEKSNEMGMKTFDQSLFDLFQNGQISESTAMRFADSANNVRLNIKLKSEALDPRAALQALQLGLKEDHNPGLTLR